MNATRWCDMKVIVNDKDKCLRKFVIGESADHDEFMGRVGGKYDFVMMVGDGEVYGFEGERINFLPIGDLRKPIGFKWSPSLNREVDFDWLPLDDEYEFGECSI